MNYGIFALSLVFGLVANAVRGLRWHILTNSVAKPLGQNPKRANAIATVLGSYSVNMIIPRAGELWRCVSYRKYEKLPLSTLIGTLITDRMADVICLALILVSVVLCYSDFFLIHLLGNYDYRGAMAHIFNAPITYVIATIGLLGVGLIGYFYRYRPESSIIQSLTNLWQGVCSIRSIEQPVHFVLYSLLIWVGYFGFFYTSFFAFNFTNELPLKAGVIAFTMSSLSVLAPVQNGMGAWHFMVITTLVAHGVSDTDAKGFALIVHALQSLWITLIGAMAIVALPIINRHYHADNNTTDN